MGNSQHRNQANSLSGGPVVARVASQALAETLPSATVVEANTFQRSEAEYLQQILELEREKSIIRDASNARISELDKELNKSKQQQNHSFLLGLIIGILIGIFISSYLVKHVDDSSLQIDHSCQNVNQAHHSYANDIDYDVDNSIQSKYQRIDIPEQFKQQARTTTAATINSISYDHNNNIYTATFSLLSFSNIMYFCGAGIIFSAYLFQFMKTQSIIVSIIYQCLYLFLAEKLFWKQESALIGGIFYCITLGIFLITLITAFHRNSFRNVTNSLFLVVYILQHITSCISTCFFFSIYAIAIYYYTSFPGILLGCFGGVYCTTFLLFVPYLGLTNNCLTDKMERRKLINYCIRMTFCFGFICAIIYILMCKSQLLPTKSSTETLKLSFLIASLNCCLYTLPGCLLNILNNSLIDHHQRQMNDHGTWRSLMPMTTHEYVSKHITLSEVIYPTSIQDYLPSVRVWFTVLVFYILLNLALVVHSVTLQTWIPVPYTLTIIPVLVFALDAHVYAIVAIPFSVVLIVGSIMLAGVRDEAVYSIFMWLGNPEIFASSILACVRGWCGTTGVVVIIGCVTKYKEVFKSLNIYSNTLLPISYLGCCFLLCSLGRVESVSSRTHWHYSLLTILLYIYTIGLYDHTIIAFKSSQGPNLKNTLLIMLTSFRLLVNGYYSSFISYITIIIMTYCLAILYFGNIIFLPSVVEGEEVVTSGTAGQDRITARNTKKKIEYALFHAPITKTIIAVVLSVLINVVAIGQQSTLLAWVGICGVYAFIASIVLRMTNDWVAIASTVTCIGCITIFTGMQLQEMMQSANMTFLPILRFFGYGNGHGTAWESNMLSVLLSMFQKVLYSK